MRTRILLVSLLGSVLCVLLVQVTGAGAAHLLIQQRQSDLREVVGEARLAACQTAPERWLYQSGMLTIWAYAPDGRSANLSAPPLPLERLPAQVGVTDITPRYGRVWTREVVQRTAPDGPCAVLFAPALDGLPALEQARRGGLLALSVGVVLLFLATVQFATAPLLLRLARLAEAARRLGTPGFDHVRDPSADALGEVSRTLDAAHDRICADQQELLQRHHALERHLTTLAHDLRTPLAALQLTLEDLHARAAADLRADVGEARLEVAYLEALADNLHQASRLRSALPLDADVSVGTVELGALLARVAQRLHILGRARGVTVESALPDAPLWVACDPVLVERALANLVHNAVIHGPAQHPVGVALDGAPGDTFRVTVASGGPALSPAVLADLQARRLQPPDRPDTDTARTRHGDGLGVAIANEVAARMGWQIAWAAGEEGGLQVTLSGPCRPAPQS